MNQARLWRQLRRAGIHWIYYFGPDMQDDTTIPPFWFAMFCGGRWPNYGTVTGEKRRPRGKVTP